MSVENTRIYTESEAKREAARCLSCESPTCKDACPAGVDVQQFIQDIATGNMTRSSRLLMTRNPLYWSCAYICPVEKQCEGSCRNAEINYPVTIAKLQAYVAEQDRLNNIISPEFPASTGKKVAIIGGGPAGLTCSWQLALKGVESVIFEKRDAIGGMVEWAVPAFRLPDEIRKSEFKRLITPLTTVRTGASAKPAVKLLDEGFDAVFIATGLQASAKAGLPGEESARFALDFLDAANAGILDCSGKRVLVVGGGNVAMDVCGTAVRTGAASVEIACMEALNEMPSCKSEIDETVGEGVVFHNRVLPKEIVVDNGSVKGLKCVSITWREPGKYVPSNAEEIPGTERFIPADILVEAIGQRPETDVDELFRGIDRERGLVRADGDTMRTNVENIYAGGDIVSGGSTVVEAVYHGNKAAAAIVETLNASD